MKNYIYLIALSIGLIFIGCSSPKPIEKRTPFSNYPLHYLGLVPTSNCNSEYQLDIFKNNTYFLRTVCLKYGMPSKANDDMGHWHIDKKGRLVLKGTEGIPIFLHIIDDKTLEVINSKNHKIDSSLNNKLKISTNTKTLKIDITNIYWKLTKIANKKVLYARENSIKAYIVLKDTKIIGNSSCNNFSTSYKLNGDEISLSDKKIMMTRMFCKDSVEKEFLSALRKMSKFKIDGNYLYIFNKKGIKLAEFESVYNK